jgi:hypothetical protein
MKYILHRCNDAARLRRGLDDPAFDGVEVDFYIELGQVRIGHEPGGDGQRGGLSMQALGEQWHDTSKILVVDIKNPDRFHHWTTDEGRRIVEAVHAQLPPQVPIFVTGITRQWIPLVRQSIDAWHGRLATYFVDAYSLARCQAKFRRPGIQFGVNVGYPLSLAKQLVTDIVPRILEQFGETALLGKSLADAFRPLTTFELNAWHRADVRMAWTVTSDETYREIVKLGPDYIIVEDMPEHREF